MTTSTFSALRLSAGMLLQLAAGVGAISGTAYGIVELYDAVHTDERQEANERKQAAEYRIADYETYAEQRKKVHFVVFSVMRTVPLRACPKDRATWTNDCEQARERWRQALIQRLDEVASEDVYYLVQKIEAALHCASSGRCASAMIEGYFLYHACTLWNQTWPYIVHVHHTTNFAPLLYQLGETENCPKVEERGQLAMASTEAASSL